MMNFSRPIVPLSLSEADVSLLAYAAELTQWLTWREIDFAHIVQEREPREKWDAAFWQDRLRHQVRRFFREQPDEPARPAFHAAQGDRLDEILRLVVERDRDLILLGHRRARSGRRSLARRLAMVAPASVWLVPEASPARITGILVPTDFSSHSADALSVAIGIAHSVGLKRVQVVHVFFDPSTVRYDEHVDEIVGQEEAAFERFVAGIDRRDIEFDPVFVEGTRPAQDILRIAGRFGTDLIVMNTRGRSKAASILLGSTTSATMAATSVPLLAIKHFGARMTLLEALANHRIWDQQSPKTN
jgi:nucleotide-binding universal stress UspA family protein